MAGVYIHIPFCKQKCHYCNFYSVASLKNRESLIDALKQEIVLQKDWLEGETVGTIYLGGGTPSILSTIETGGLLESIFRNYDVNNDAEITMEANPDDLGFEQLGILRTFGINRLSIGVQSFQDNDLLYLNRIHNASQALTSIKAAQGQGFNNLSIDLIYGIPTLTDDNWILNLETFLNLDIPHLSAYALTVEPKTALDILIKKGKHQNVDDARMVAHFSILCDKLEKKGFKHYEISNFGKEGYYSKHNIGYWNGNKYLGIGPSAHSFNGKKRQWNVSNISKYTDAISRGVIPFETEHLSADQKYNEYVLTSIRTMWGTDIELIKRKFGKNYADHFIREIEDHVLNGMVILSDNCAFLTKKGKLFADKISSDLFI